MNYYNTLQDTLNQPSSNIKSFYSFITKERILYDSEHFFIARDGFPVSKGHLLIISKRVVPNFFDLNEDENKELHNLIRKAKLLIEIEFSPTGYNIGMNCGIDSGQTIMHFHCHVIPRYIGDMEDPRGGVRNCIPDKGNYLK